MLLKKVKRLAVPVSRLRFRESTRLQCLYGCPRGGSHPLCPPACESVEMFRDALGRYRHAEVFFSIVPCADTSRLTRRRNEFQMLLLERERDYKKAGEYYSIAFVSGACALCRQTCALRSCDRHLLGRASVCATGIDLEHLCRHILKLGREKALSFFVPQKSALLLGIVFHG